MIQGFIEVVDERTIAGAAWDPQNPNTIFFVELRNRAGVVIAIRANLMRADLRQKGIGEGCHGFSVTLPNGFLAKDERPGSIIGRIAGTEHVLEMTTNARRFLNRATAERPLLSRLMRSIQKKKAANAAMPQPVHFDNVARQLARKQQPQNAPFAKIHTITGGRLEILTNATPEEAAPILMIAGRPAWLSAEVAPVADQPGFSTQHVFYISGIAAGDELALSMADGEQTVLCEVRTATETSRELSVMQQLSQATKIARQPGAVAIICGDGAHHAMHRACALYRAVKPHRPVVLFCFQKDVVGLELEPTLSLTDVTLVTLPWSRRYLYARMSQAMGALFETTWMVGDDVPAFLLSAIVTGESGHLVLDFPPEAPETADLLERNTADLPSRGLQNLFLQHCTARTAADDMLAERHDAIVAKTGERDSDLVAVLQGVSKQGPGPAFITEMLPITIDRPSLRATTNTAQPTLLLVWKQQDAGLYGRRIDQICRSYRQTHPDHRVVVLELMNPVIDQTYRQTVHGFSEFTYLREMNTLKRQGVLDTADGVEYRQVFANDPHDIPLALEEFLVAQDISPANTAVILFPNIQHAERVFDLLCPYPLIVDVVDNQMLWALGQARLDVFRQYYMMCNSANCVIFNSERNAVHFDKSGLFIPTQGPATVIPNWYQQPSGFDAQNRPLLNNASAKATFDIVYAGNMNDRIDWPLIHKTLALDPRIRLFLIGEARNATDQLFDILKEERAIYLGPLDEDRTLTQLQRADLAIIPHLVDEVSTFMNPLKAQMYQSVSLPAVAMAVPGLVAGPDLTITADHGAFLASVKDHMNADKKPNPVLSSDLPSDARRYIEAISQVRADAVPVV